MLVRGYFDAATYLSSFSTGKAIYIQGSGSTATMNTTAPTGSGEYVRILGYCTNTPNVIYFNPSRDWVEIS
jgi:hypothetical protein